MSYSANNYNYATPLSSSAKLTSPVNLQLIDGRSIHSTFTGVIDSDNIVTISGSNSGTSEQYVNYFILHSNYIKPSTQYYLVFELFDFSGTFALMKLTNDDVGDSQISTNLQFAQSALRRGVAVYPVTSRSNLDARNIAVRSYVRINAGQSFTMRYRLSLLPYAPDPATFVYQKYEGTVYPLDTKFFELSNNVLDGSYYPVTDDAGIWSASAPSVSNPFVVTVEESLTMNAFRLISSKYNYPVDFTVQFYNGATLLRTLTVTDNNSAVFVEHFSNPLNVTKYVVSITEASLAGAAVPIYNLYNPGELVRSDTLKLKQLQVSTAYRRLDLSRADTLGLKQTSVTAPRHTSVYSADAAKVGHSESRNLAVSVRETDILGVTPYESDRVNNSFSRQDALKVRELNTSRIKNDINADTKTVDIAVCSAEEGLHIVNTVKAYDTIRVSEYDQGALTNVHTLMKAPSRRIYGKVNITYTDPLLNDVITNITTNSEAYNSQRLQLTDGERSVDDLFFTLYDNDLTGSYKAGSASSQVGWTSATLSDANGLFSTAPYINMVFAARPVTNLSIIFDDSHGVFARDLTVVLTDSVGATYTYSITNNTEAEVAVFSSALANIVSIRITITKVSKAYSPVTILDIPTISTFVYVGYQDKSDLINMRVLEELTYEDDVEALGGVSANEVQVTLDNSSRAFNFNNVSSPVASQLKRNRKIVPFLGVEVIPNEIEWHQLGVYWSYSWDVPYDSLLATVTGFDTIGLLGSTTFYDHTVQANKSLGWLLEYVLNDAKNTFSFLTWSIAPELYSIVIPYAWFEYGSHAAALRSISLAYPMHIYCDRSGRIVAAPQKLQLDYYYDKWANNTNVMSKEYSSLYTVLPNIINVKVVAPIQDSATELVKDTLEFDVSDISTRLLNFSSPYLSDLEVTIDCDNSVQYTYTVYSWGIEFSFTGTGYVRSIVCSGTSLNISNTSVVTWKDTQSLAVNGSVTRDISSNFIQTSALASALINRIVALSTNDKYDVEVTYRGDIALTINDPILLIDGLAPDSRYNIKRQELTWDGSLSGVANLNT